MGADSLHPSASQQLIVFRQQRGNGPEPSRQAPDPPAGMAIL